MPVIIHPADLPILADDPIFYLIQTIAFIRVNLLINRVLDPLKIVRMHHPLKGISCQFLELIKIGASVDFTNLIVRIDQFSFFVLMIDKKSSRDHFGHLPDHRQCKPGQCEAIGIPLSSVNFVCHSGKLLSCFVHAVVILCVSMA